ncbi:hypothetical protein SCRM01_247 [Synechococcus phage S-CRM01]|uniref:hypothetical protein n=1 Tax=Synechococcus phage S-CRM01 TaxID=1026955 RepID=UPI000209E448|nr:hypothetical protein SCRM01_247 [Synechococcus phage S-CRM01]AEC53193.1 hypothetical protein SCRM01_247 [Synechococcus phage S-CRM01]
MKLLLVNLKAPVDSVYVNPEKVGVYMLGRPITRYAIFAVCDDNTMHRIEITSAEITELQKEVDAQYELICLREQVKELTERLQVAEALLPQQIPAKVNK